MAWWCTSLPAPPIFRDPKVGLDSRLPAVNGFEAMEEFSRRHDHEIDASSREALEHEHPVVRSREAQFLAVERPPAARPETRLKLRAHVGYQKILGELDLQGHGSAVAAIRTRDLCLCLAWAPTRSSAGTCSRCASRPGTRRHERRRAFSWRVPPAAAKCLDAQRRPQSSGARPLKRGVRRHERLLGRP
jgi:hypothetical protein